MNWWRSFSLRARCDARPPPEEGGGGGCRNGAAEERGAAVLRPSGAALCMHRVPAPHAYAPDWRMRSQKYTLNINAHCTGQHSTEHKLTLLNHSIATAELSRYVFGVLSGWVLACAGTV